MAVRLVSILSVAASVALTACSATPAPVTLAPSAAATATATSPAPPAPIAAGMPFAVQELGKFDQPWAMTFLPGTSDALITQRGGALKLRLADGRVLDVAGVPSVAAAGQGGLGDIIAAPTYAADRTVYLSWAAAGGDKSGAEVGRATLAADGSSARLVDLTTIWRQQPKTTGTGHYGHRLAFSPDGRFLFITSGERQKFDPAQDLGTNLGKVLRLNPDGSPAAGNPFADRGGVAAEIWTDGHRNPLGIAFDSSGNLWSSEMGPRGGDELNLIVPGRNYGWPKVSNGSQYSGEDIPDHAAGDGFEAPKAWWNPSISPSSLMIYTGSEFPDWNGDAFIGALSGQALIRVHLDGATATKADQWAMGARIREVEQAPDGTIWVLEDGPGGRLLRLTKP